MNKGGASAGSSLRLDLLGGFSLRRANGQEVSITSQKNRLLLAYLASNSTASHSRDQLADLLWFDRQTDQARGSLRTALSALKQAMGGEVLQSDRSSVRLAEGAIETDLRDLVEVSNDPSSDLCLEDIYSGELLANQEIDGGRFADWLRATREEYRGLAVSVLAAVAERLEKQGNIAAAIDRWREVLSLEAVREDTHRQIMRLYSLNGERAMALSQFRSCKELLLHELGVSPDPETTALAESIAKREAKPVKTQFAPDLVIDEGASANESKNRSEAQGKPSIAVLPFVNMSGDAEQSYFTDGIWEDVLTDLNAIENLSVAAKSAGGVFRGAAISPKQIADELGVQFILEGSVRKAGDQVRISVQLTDARKNLQVWADRFDRQLDNIFEVQTEVSSSIAEALSQAVSDDMEGPVRHRAETDPETYDTYLRARALLRNADWPSVEAARELFAKVVDRDPTYARGYTGLADCGTILAQHYDVGSETLDEALANCDRALAIDQNLAEAFAAKGYILTHRTDKEAAAENLLKASEMNPGLADAHYYLAKFYLGAANQPNKALTAAQRAYDLEPDLRTGMVLIACLSKVGNEVDVKRVGEHSIALAKRRLAIDPYDASAAMHLALHLAYLGREEEGVRWARLASNLETNDGSMAYNLACAFSVLGLIDEALEQIKKTLDLGCSKVKLHYMTKTDPDIEPIRGDPRFKAMIADYWKKRVSARQAARSREE